MSALRSQIQSDRIPGYALLVLAATLLLNAAVFSLDHVSYLLYWISASLYFYIIYPVLPLILFAVRTALGKKKRAVPAKEGYEPLVSWARKIKILSHKHIGFRLFWRFFIFSLIPLTAGIIVIYGFSMVSAVVLGVLNPSIPIETAQLIGIQCLGIIAFYLEIYIFRNRFYALTGILRQPKDWQDRKRMFMVLAVGFVLVLLAILITVLIIIAIFLPGFTLSTFLNVNSFVRIKTNLGVILVLASQFIIMQFIQSIFSRRFALDMCNTLITRLEAEAGALQDSRGLVEKKPGDAAILPDERRCRTLLSESELYSINRKQMFKLFPTYSLGIAIPALMGISDLDELKDMFQME